MTAIDQSLAVREALYAALTAALPTVPVHDMAPVGSQYPFIEMMIEVTDDSSKTDHGQAHAVDLHVWVKGVTADCAAIMATIFSSLAGVSLAIPGFTATPVIFTGSRMFTDADPQIVHGIGSYRLTTS